jgi:hypothetical protein
LAASAIGDHQVDRSWSSLQGNLANAQGEHALRPRTNPPTEREVRNAIERVTVTEARIEIVLDESIVVEGQDRVLTLPWTRASSLKP